MKKIIPGLLLCVKFLVLSVVAYPQQTVEKIVTETHYLLYLPASYNADTSQRWPLLMFLHGSGESGNDIKKVKVHGPPQLIEQGRQFPFIVVSPQSPSPNGWDVDQLYKLLQQVKKKYRVDPDRVYLTGLSMGGFGTWALAVKHPEEFAAIAPVCGGGDTSGTWRIRNIPIWCFHGDLDNVVPISGSENMVRASARWNPNVRFTVYKNTNHNSWDTTYNANDSLYKWLLDQKRFRYKEIPLNSSGLQKYHGTFVGQDRDTVKITTRDNELVAVTPDGPVVLKSAGQNTFFLDPDKNMDVRFISGSNGIQSFVFFGDRRLVYSRVGKK